MKTGRRKQVVKKKRVAHKMINHTMIKKILKIRRIEIEVKNRFLLIVHCVDRCYHIELERVDDENRFENRDYKMV